MRTQSKDVSSRLFDGSFLRSVAIDPERVPSFAAYPFSIPAIRRLGMLEFDPRVTFFVGENGSGKSTLVEAIAVAAGYNAEGGSRNLSFATRSTESLLHEALWLARGIRRERSGYFLRAESLYNVATHIDELDEHPDNRRESKVIDSYGGVSLHKQSHGESFLSLITHGFRSEGLYLLDEPEAALSPSRQLTLLVILDQLARKQGSQFVIATHSPILLAYPHAVIYRLDQDGIKRVAYEDTEHYKVTLDFLTNREAYFRHLCGEAEDELREGSRDGTGD